MYPLAPATMAWHCAHDVRQWFRYAPAIGISRVGRWALLPLLVPLSLAARGAEAIGMYATMIATDRVRQWAESS